MLMQLLQDDEDLFLMNLTRLWSEPALMDASKPDKELITDDVEILLESYLMNANKYE